MQKDAKNTEAQRIAAGPKTGDRRARSQRKSRGSGNQSQKSSSRKRSSFKKR